jgi:hypothetical protein
VPDITIATFERGPTERLAVQFREFETHHFLDVRIQFLGSEGQWLPTRRGLTIKLRELYGFADAVTKACDLASKVKK